MKWRQTVGFMALCLLSSARWLVSDALPQSLTPLAGAGFNLLLIGGVFLALAGSRRRTHLRPTVIQCGLVAAGSLGLIGVPLLVLALTEGKITSASAVLVFAFMPVLLAVAGAVSASEASGLGTLPAGLMGAAGLLVLLPSEIPRGRVGIVSFCAVLLAMVSVAASMTWLHRLLRAFPIVAAIGIAGVANGVALSGAALVLETPQWTFHHFEMEALRGLALDMPETVLLIWLTKLLAPKRLAVRYLVAPLLTVVEGLILLKPAPDLRTVTGLLLLGGGIYLLLRPERPEAKIGLNLTSSW